MDKLIEVMKADLKKYTDRLNYLVEEEPDEMHMIVKYGHIISIIEKYLNFKG